MSERLLLAGDCGGSKSVLVLVNDEGEFKDVHTMGTVNPNHLGGMEHSARTLQVGTEELLAKAGYDPDDRITAAVLGVAGIDTSDDERAMATMLHVFADQVEVHNDVMLPLGMLPESKGVALVAGTGSNCSGRNSLGETAQSGGHGRNYDEGGALWMGNFALGLASKIEDGRSASLGNQGESFVANVYNRAATSIQFMRKSKEIDDGYSKDSLVTIQRFSDLYPVLYQHGPEVERRLLHDIAPTILDMAEEGMPDAMIAVRQGAKELASHVKAVSGKLLFSHVPLIVTGSMLSRRPVYREALALELGAIGVELEGTMRVVHSPIRSAITMAQAMLQRTR